MLMLHYFCMEIVEMRELKCSYSQLDLCYYFSTTQWPSSFYGKDSASLVFASISLCAFDDGVSVYMPFCGLLSKHGGVFVSL